MRPIVALSLVGLMACGTPDGAGGLEGVSLSPPAPTSLDELTVVVELWGSAELSDLSWRWERDGERIVDLDEPRVEASWTARGEVWRVVATYEGPDGTSEESAEVTIGNAGPTEAPVVVLDPTSGFVHETDLRCVASLPEDPDGDPLDAVFRWERDGVAFEGAIDQPLESWVPVDRAGSGASWTCHASAKDPEGARSPEASASASLVPRLPLAMLRIEPGSFEISGWSLSLAPEAPLVVQPRGVTLTHPYELGVHEIRRSDWVRWRGSAAGLAGHDPPCDDCAAYGISWHEAASFANDVSRSVGLPECYTCVAVPGTNREDCEQGFSPYACEGYRLPTDAEWEYAARAGGVVPMEGFPSGALPLDPYHSFNCIGLECYSECKDVPLQGGGNLLDEAVFCYSGVSDTQPVMGLRPSLWGFYDLGGNVFEHVHDCWNPPDGALDPHGGEASECYEHVLRGGDFNSIAVWSTVGARWLRTPDSHLGGMRLARSLPLTSFPIPQETP